MFPNSIAAFGKTDAVSRDQYAADFQAQTNNLNTMLQMLRCVAYKATTGQVVATATNTPLTFDTNKVDVGFLHEVVTHPTRFTARVRGFYFVLGQVDFLAGVGGTSRAIEVSVNGAFPATVAPATVVVPNANATRLQVSALLALDYLDYVEFVAYQDSGGNITTSPTNTWGSMILLSRL